MNGIQWGDLSSIIGGLLFVEVGVDILMSYEEIMPMSERFEIREDYSVL